MGQDILSDLPDREGADRGAVPVRRQGLTLGGQVTEAIIDMIGRGQLIPGQRLVESDIARKLGVGTVPVREALRILAGDGVVEIKPNRGAVLCAWSVKEIIDTLKAVVGLLKVALEAIPPDAMAELAPRLEPVIGRLSKAAGEGDKFAFFDCSERIQREILVVAGNLYILRSVDRVHFDFYNTLIIQHVCAKDIKKIARKYHQIYRKILVGDIAAIKRLFDETAGMLESYLMAMDKT